MAALAACGVGPGYILRAVLVVALVLALVQGAFALFLAPWAEAQGERLKQQSQQTADIKGIQPGRFRELPQGKGVIYVETISEDYSEIRNIFVQEQYGARRSIITAASGQLVREPETGDRFLVLHNGHRYEGRPGSENYTIVDFERHGLRIQERELRAVSLRHKAIPTRTLLATAAQPQNMAEL